MSIGLAGACNRTAQGSTPGSAEAGYVAVDALVALTILATTISLSLAASATARRVGAAAVEARAATALLRHLAESPVAEDGVGRAPGFDWRVETTPLGGGTGSALVKLCRRDAAARSRRDGRRFAVATLLACPQAATS